MTLFNVTGMKYSLSSKAIGANEQYVSEHRDLAHFKWSDKYERDGRIELSLKNLGNLKQLIQASKATGAFPVGLRARLFERKAKYIWDNPFFRKNKKFGKGTIDLGKTVQDDDDIYMSLNADGGTSNNEPVELVRDLMLQIRLKEENNLQLLDKVNAMDDTARKVLESKLKNYSIFLVDPFPSYDFDVVKPTQKSDNLTSYVLELIFALNSQLQFDAKEAIDAYDKESYGLHIIAPSRDEADKPEYAIACGALGGFGGFLSMEYRIHDFFLGRHNCQSFIRKYFVVDAEESEFTNGKANENYQCIKAVLEGYENKEAIDRFCFKDEKGKKWLPIIPDVDLKSPIVVIERQINASTKKVSYEEPGKLPLYQMDLPPNNFLQKYRDKLKERTNMLINNLYDSNWFGDFVIGIAAMAIDDKVADAVIATIKKDLIKIKLIKK